MKALQISRSFDTGGAARAANRVHRAVIHQGVESKLLPVDNRRWARTRRMLDRMMLELDRPESAAPRSACLAPTALSRSVGDMPSDVINLHWVGSGALGIADIGRLPKPVVWTMHDMWPFTGTDHYAPDGPGARWRSVHRSDNRQPGRRGIDLDRYVWAAKHRNWQRSFSLVAPSHWLARCASESSLMGRQTTAVIPNPLDIDLFAPTDKEDARRRLGLPASSPLVLFGAVAATSDPRKGWDLLTAAMRQVRHIVPGVEAVVFGGRLLGADEAPIPIHDMGVIEDDRVLVDLYNAVDVTAVPSRMDNLPQTATEAQACGCPVVAFDVGGLADAVEQGATGYLVAPFDTRDFAVRAGQVLMDEALSRAMAEAARVRAVRLWSPGVVGTAYRTVYESAIEEWRREQDSTQ